MKTTKKLLILLLAVAIALAITSCAPTVCDVHVDTDGDSVCDVCQTYLCAHEDTTDDEICDFCGAEMEHKTCADGNKDGKCDKCEKCLEHNDADYNRVCDNCKVEIPFSTLSEALAAGLKLADGSTSKTLYYITATVKSVTDARFGAMILEDETGTLSVYNTSMPDGTAYPNMTDIPDKGDKVTVACILKNFKGEVEINKAYLISFEDVAVDDSAYTEMNVAGAREAAKGDKVKVTGVVASITYASGMKPAGFILVDNSSSIYVYDAGTAGLVSIGNTVTILAEKDYWILDSELTHANKHGYGGCNQLAGVYLVENDNGNTEFDKSWIDEITVKDLLEIPVTEDITTLIYKTNALITKEIGGDYVNYYINDIDGTTGSYVYTQANGQDFAWLDQYVGKICTVYVTPLNAKSQNTYCNFRFSPILVIDEGYEFDMENVYDYVYNYHLINQFAEKYSANPNKALISAYADVLLGFDGVTIEYTSDNEATIKIEMVDGVPTLVCVADGKATITTTVTYGGVYKSFDIEITYEESKFGDLTSVKDAAALENDTEVTIKGIVVGSCTNQPGGIYVLDETGIMAVIFSSTDSLKGISIGNEIVIKGIKAVRSNGGTAYYGQTNIKDATLVANLYGNHEYPTDSFISGKTVEELYSLNPLEDHTNEVYRVTATIKLVGSGNSAQYKLLGEDDEKMFSFYSGNASQFDWLSAYKDQTVELEVAIVNWNNRTYYRGCAISIIVDGVRVAVNDLYLKGE